MKSISSGSAENFHFLNKPCELKRFPHLMLRCIVILVLPVYQVLPVPCRWLILLPSPTLALWSSSPPSTHCPLGISSSSAVASAIMSMDVTPTYVYFNPTLDWEPLTLIHPSWISPGACLTSICKPIDPKMASDPPLFQICSPPIVYILMMWVYPYSHLWVLPPQILLDLSFLIHLHCHRPSSGSTISCQLLS